MTVTTDKGHYYFKTSKDWIKFQNDVCGVYFMANADEVIQVHFDHMDMPCESQNLVSVSFIIFFEKHSLRTYKKS